MCVSDPSCDCRGRLRHAGNRWQRRSRLEGSARLVTRQDVEVAAGPEAPAAGGPRGSSDAEAPAMQVTLPAGPASPLDQWERAWSANDSRWYWWNPKTRESRWDPPSTASFEAPSSSQKEIAAGPEAPAMQVTLPAGPASPLDQW